MVSSGIRFRVRGVGGGGKSPPHISTGILLEKDGGAPVNSITLFLASKDRYNLSIARFDT